MLGTPAYYCLIGLQAVRSVLQAYIIQVGLNIILLTGALLYHFSILFVCAATAASIAAGSVYLIAALPGILNRGARDSNAECVAAEIA
jgi:hypothetical protein